ncbi:MAG: ribonuclease H-like domain-containing protein [Dehalococcoidaceae bacterium]|nr:ribonuclease H-like domain-containing protein [Dehalococcoidaceae bacterium]
MPDAYIDIETTGLSPASSSITVVGIYLVDGTAEQLVQLVGSEITPGSITEVVRGIETIYTFNGHRFDLPFIRQSTGVDLHRCCRYHRDLMFDCWHNNLYGGLKKVEVLLGIGRQIQGVGGREAVTLWYRYVECGDFDALDTLLKYNAEDVKNLKALREKLETIKTGINRGY